MRKIKILVFFLFVVGLASTLSDQVGAQTGFLRCYQRRITDTSIDCSRCDNIDDYDKEKDLCETASTSNTFDTQSCTCVSTGSSCAGRSEASIESAASTCYANGNFWNDNYCQCVLTTGTPVVTPGGSIVDDVSESFFHVNFDGSVESLSELIRLGFIVFFVVIAVAALFLGLYGMYLYTSAGEDDEKVQKAQKVFKNAFIGLAIAVFGVIIVQIVAIIVGVGEGIFDYTFDVS